jgi:hypothetical protein
MSNSRDTRIVTSTFPRRSLRLLSAPFAFLITTALDLAGSSHAHGVLGVRAVTQVMAAP